MRHAGLIKAVRLKLNGIALECGNEVFQAAKALAEDEGSTFKAGESTLHHESPARACSTRAQ